MLFQSSMDPESSVLRRTQSWVFLSNEQTESQGHAHNLRRTKQAKGTMKLVYQTNQQANYSLSGSSLSLLSLDSIKEEQPCHTGPVELIEDDSSSDGDSSSSGNQPEDFQISRSESQETLTSSPKVLTFDGYELDPVSTSPSIQDTSTSSLGTESEDTHGTVEVATRGGLKGVATTELHMMDLGLIVLGGANHLSRLSNLRTRSTNLFWAPGRQATPWAMYWNTIWWLWSPLVSPVSSLEDDATSRGSRERHMLELSVPDCAPYFERSVLSCTCAEDGKRIVKEILRDEIYSSVRSIVEQSRFVVDIGANVGAFAAWVAAKKSAASRKVENSKNTQALTVLCLEPVPSTAAACERNASRAMRKHSNTSIKVAKIGLAPTKKDFPTESSSVSMKQENMLLPKLTYFEGTPSSSTTHPQIKYESSIKPLLQSDRSFLDYYGMSRPNLCAMIESLPFAGLRQAFCEVAVAFLWRWKPLTVKLGSLLEAFNMTRTELPETIDLLKVDIGVAMDFIEDWWWPKVQNVLIEEVASSTQAQREEVLAFLKSKGYHRVQETHGAGDSDMSSLSSSTSTGSLRNNRYMVLSRGTSTD